MDQGSNSDLSSLYESHGISSFIFSLKIGSYIVKNSDTFILNLLNQQFNFLIILSITYKLNSSILIRKLVCPVFRKYSRSSIERPFLPP